MQNEDLVLTEETTNKVTLSNISRLRAGVRCKTKVEAYKLLSYLDKIGIKWIDGQRTIDDLNYRYGSDTCYMFDDRYLTYSDLKSLIASDFVVYDFNAVLLSGKLLKYNEKNLFKVLGVKCGERFKLTGKPKKRTYFINSQLRVIAYNDDRDTSFPTNCGSWYDLDMVLYYNSMMSYENGNQLIIDIITDKYSIIKIPQEE